MCVCTRTSEETLSAAGITRNRVSPDTSATLNRFYYANSGCYCFYYLLLYYAIIIFIIFTTTIMQCAQNNIFNRSPLTLYHSHHHKSELKHTANNFPPRCIDGNYAIYMTQGQGLRP